ncbi:hypothetical protein [Candidatus Uabimicrobium amorphum]|uniref:Pentapeptide repeat-containing protein n=1 Tax=Uabimicrobium amorphum TaxID=2596890 RepID=A0A5S9ITJ0_UABAM|nr:hypothetical protein [Candidatus Uabimicrobium amorphum]BBM87161.1 hypothetical protein UABAM_05564 [Candidatus Uabimicrobium amorphum]
MADTRVPKLKDIKENTSYYGCAFFIEKERVFNIKNCKFENCSFRTDITFDKIENCQFINCNFSNDFTLPYRSQAIEKLPPEIFTLANLTRLDLPKY